MSVLYTGVICLDKALVMLWSIIRASFWQQLIQHLSYTQLVQRVLEFGIDMVFGSTDDTYIYLCNNQHKSDVVEN